MLIHMSTWTVLKDLVKKPPDKKKCFYRSLKDGTAGGNGKKLNSHVTDEEYLDVSKFRKFKKFKKHG